MRTRLNLIQLEAREVPDAASVALPVTPPALVRTADLQTTAAEAQQAVGNTLAAVATQRGELASALQSALQNVSGSAGYGVARVEAFPSPDGVVAGRSNVDLLVYVTPRPGDAVPPGMMTLVYVPQSGLDRPPLTQNIGWQETKDAIGHGIVGGLAGAVAGGLTGGAVGSVVAAPGFGTVVGGAGGAIGGFIYGAFFADDSADAAKGGVLIGYGAGLLLVPAGAMIQAALAGNTVVLGGGAITAAGASNPDLIAKATRVATSVRFMQDNGQAGTQAGQNMIAALAQLNTELATRGLPPQLP